MRRLLLLRHAEAERPAGGGDHERPLAEGGRQDSARMGAYMAAAGLRPDLAIVSTARRAQETWALARPAFTTDIAQRDEPRIYEASAAAIVQLIGDAGAATATLLLVGHNPAFHQLALQLAGSGDATELRLLRRGLPTAGLAVIDFDAGDWRELAPGAGRLQRLAAPR